MSSATDALELLIGRHLFRTATWTKPTALYVALFATLPADDGTGGVEVTGGSYGRILHGPSDATWSDPTAGNGEFSNLTVVTFAIPTANWGNVVGAGIYDQSSGGVLLLKNALDTARNIVAGDPAPNFPPGSLKFIIA